MARKLLTKLALFFDTDRASQQRELDSIVKVTKKLKVKMLELREALEVAETQEERDDIMAKLEVIEAQRDKAVKLIKGLRREQDTDDVGTLATFLDTELTSQQMEIDSITQVMNKLEVRAQDLRQALETASSDEERDQIISKLEVIEAQLAKALKLVQELGGEHPSQPSEVSSEVAGGDSAQAEQTDEGETRSSNQAESSQPSGGGDVSRSS